MKMEKFKEALDIIRKTKFLRMYEDIEIIGMEEVSVFEKDDKNIKLLQELIDKSQQPTEVQEIIHYLKTEKKYRSDYEVEKMIDNTIKKLGNLQSQPNIQELIEKLEKAISFLEVSLVKGLVKMYISDTLDTLRILLEDLKSTQDEG